MTYKHHIPGDNIAYEAELKEESRRRGLMRSKQRLAMIQEWFSLTHEWQLHRGGVPMGKPRLLSGREAYELNKKYEKDFIKALDRDANARMYRLRHVRIVSFEDGTPVPEGFETIGQKSRKRNAHNTRRSLPGLSDPRNLVKGCWRK